MIIEGAIAVKAAMASSWRTVNEILIDQKKRSKDISYIIHRAQEQNITVRRCPREEIEAMVSGKTHGGIIARAGQRTFQSLDELLTVEKPFLILVEGVEDSYNLGYIMRTAYAFGCNGIILPSRVWDFDDSIILKSSAGASDRIPVHLSRSLADTLDLIREKGIKIVSAYRGNNSVDLYESNLTGQGVLIGIGGPLRGLSSEVLDRTDMFVHIPYANDFRNALNAVSAAAVICGEVYRQNHKGE